MYNARQIRCRTRSQNKQAALVRLVAASLCPVALLVAVSLVLLPRASYGQSAHEELQKFVASDRSEANFFGSAVSVYGDRALVGAPNKDANTGSAYVFRRSPDGTWTEEAKLTASDAAEGDFFGGSLAIAGDVAVVAARRSDVGGVVDAGSAYVFRRKTDGTWLQEAKLTASDAAQSDFLGAGVSLLPEGAVLIGAPDDDDAGPSSGSVYVFRDQGDGTWIQEAKLTASDAASFDAFGVSVSIDSGVAIVGAIPVLNTSTDPGSAYVFRDNGDGTWTEEAKLTASDADGRDFFGISVSVSDDVALVGAVPASFDSADTGSAYVFRDQGDGTWTEETKLTAPDANEGDFFGVSVVVDGHTALVGARSNDESGPDAGAVYLFRDQLNSTWSAGAKLTASDTGEGDAFGSSVSLDDDTALVGAPSSDDTGSTDSGAAYLFDFNERPTASEALPELVTDLTLGGNYPNPFKSRTTIRYGLAQTTEVHLVVHDLLGREVAVLLQGAVRPAGWHEVPFYTTDLPNGIYLYRLRATGIVRTGQVILLR